MTPPPLVTRRDPPFLVALAAAAWAAASWGAAGGGPPEALVVHGPGTTLRRPLTPGRHRVEGPRGPTVIRVGPGAAAWVESSPCPAALCRKQGPARVAGAVRACVPNQVWFELAGPRARGGLDGVTQ